MLKGIEFLLKKSRGKVGGGKELSFLAPVILGRDAQSVHRILWQRVSKLVNKFALFLHKYQLRDDSRDKTWNDGCEGRRFSVCCMFVKRMYHSGSSANELSLKAKDDVSCFDFKRLLDYYCKPIKYPSPEALASTSPSRGEVGRSMIEMLGVLAIISVLSVGGIAGYSKAMEKFKVNKLIEEYNSLIFGLLENKPKLPLIGPNSSKMYYWGDVVKALNLVPETWKYVNWQYLEDSQGNYIAVRSDEISGVRQIVVDFNLGGLQIDADGNQKTASFSKKLCFEMFNNLVYPLHSTLIRAYVYTNGVDRVYYYGDAYCGDGKKCISELTLSNFKQMCSYCDNNRRCNVTVAL